MKMQIMSLALAITIIAWIIGDRPKRNDGPNGPNPGRPKRNDGPAMIIR